MINYQLSQKFKLIGNGEPKFSDLKNVGFESFIVMKG
jgi:hypothetical protein